MGYLLDFLYELLILAAFVGVIFWRFSPLRMGGTMPASSWGSEVKFPKAFWLFVAAAILIRIFVSPHVFDRESFVFDDQWGRGEVAMGWSAAVAGLFAAPFNSPKVKNSSLAVCGGAVLALTLFLRWLG